MALRTRLAVSGVTPGSSLTTRDTVLRATPARVATSFMVGRPRPFRVTGAFSLFSGVARGRLSSSLIMAPPRVPLVALRERWAARLPADALRTRGLRFPPGPSLLQNGASRPMRHSFFGGVIAASGVAARCAVVVFGKSTLWVVSVFVRFCAWSADAPAGGSFRLTICRGGPRTRRPGTGAWMCLDDDERRRGADHRLGRRGGRKAPAGRPRG